MSSAVTSAGVWWSRWSDMLEMFDDVIYGVKNTILKKGHCHSLASLCRKPLILPSICTKHFV